MRITTYFKTEEAKESGIIDAVKLLEEKGTVKVVEKGNKTFVLFDLNTKKKKKERKEKQEVETGQVIYTYPQRDPEGNETIVNTEIEQCVAEIINRFKDVNPNYKEWFSRMPVRSAIKKVIKNYDMVTIFKVLDVIKYTNAMEYAPVITTPTQLKNKLPVLLAFIQKKKKEGDSGFKISF